MVCLYAVVEADCVCEQCGEPLLRGDMAAWMDGEPYCRSACVDDAELDALYSGVAVAAPRGWDYYPA